MKAEISSRSKRCLIMAKTGVVEAADPRVAELKRELQRLVRSIVEDDDCGVDVMDRAREALSSIKDLKIKRSVSLKLRRGADSFPEEFRCPLSREVMRDPVILATGQTYDRPFIEKWLKAGNRTCPLTQQVLSHTVLTPNHLIREMISQWCKSNGIELTDSDQYNHEDMITEPDRSRFISLLEKMSSSDLDKREAAKELRSLTKRMPSFRALFGETVDSIPQLLNPFSGNKGGIHPELQEDLITTLLNLSILDSNKKLVAETPVVIPLLVDALKCGTIQTRSNAAATIFTLSALDSNKALIGQSGVLKPLIDLLDEGHPSAMKDVASAIFNLCIIHENKSRAVRDGAIKVLMKKINNRTHVDELLAILAILSTNQKAIEEMGDLGAVSCLLVIIRESSCDRNKENCIAILHSVCLNDRTKLRELKEEENTYRTISKLAQTGTARAKRKANGILERLRRAVNITHTA